MQKMEMKSYRRWRCVVLEGLVMEGRGVWPWKAEVCGCRSRGVLLQKIEMCGCRRQGCLQKVYGNVWLLSMCSCHNLVSQYYRLSATCQTLLKGRTVSQQHWDVCHSGFILDTQLSRAMGCDVTQSLLGLQITAQCNLPGLKFQGVKTCQMLIQA